VLIELLFCCIQLLHIDHIDVIVPSDCEIPYTGSFNATNVFNFLYKYIDR